MPLHFAARDNHIEEAMILVNAGATTDIKNKVLLYSNNYIEGLCRYSVCYHDNQYSYSKFPNVINRSLTVLSALMDCLVCR